MQDLTRSLALGVLIAAFCSLTSPFGAVIYLPLWGRFLYWFGLIAIVLGIDFGLRTVRMRMDRPGSFVSRLVEVTALSAPVVFVSILAVQHFIGRPVPASFFAQLFLSVCVITAAIVSVVYLIHAYPALNADGSEPVADDTDPIAGFRRLLPFEFRPAEIYAVSAEDHYVRVHTAAGTTLLHMRLSDAIELLADVPGAKPHRSWWVFKSGVEAVRRTGGKLQVHLRSGEIAPVSRTGAKALKELGWI